MYHLRIPKDTLLIPNTVTFPNLARLAHGADTVTVVVDAISCGGSSGSTMQISQPAKREKKVKRKKGGGGEKEKGRK